MSFWQGFEKQANLKKNMALLGGGAIAGALGVSHLKNKRFKDAITTKDPAHPSNPAYPTYVKTVTQTDLHPQVHKAWRERLGKK